MSLYLDASAVVKLVRREPETSALVERVGAHPERVSASIVRVEVSRAIRRAGMEARESARADAILERMSLVALDPAIIRVASSLEPADLRALDAVHLATALALGEDLAAFVTYDRRLAAAATIAGLVVDTPR